MAFTRSELFQNFEGEYTTEQVIQALTQLAEIDKQIDPSAELFDESIVEQLEDIFGIIQDAVDKQKLLATSGSSLTPVEDLAVELAGDRLDIPKETFKGFVEILAGRAIAQATVIHQFTNQLFKDVQGELQAQSLQETTQETAEQVAFMMQLIQNPETRQRIAQDYGLKQNHQVATELKTVTTTTTDFDPDAFLAEVSDEKKSITPGLKMTIPDTKSLVKTLLSQSCSTNLNVQAS
ncbi:hypothetical protein [Nostoc sp. JL23]|uniref:hypothetical protein n=1 Tax=Nostoc sp. JL23 TaxID=2815394 RepID=UPI001D8B5D2D|nr:hypothetical protein [Nostoc sp. JL23]MBN3875177.1 hypothetical protein [Nostoc sp. JL23]